MNLIACAPLWLRASARAGACLPRAIEDVVRLRISNVTVLVVLAARIVGDGFRRAFVARCGRMPLVFAGHPRPGHAGFLPRAGSAAATSSCSRRPACGSTSAPRPGCSPRSSSPAEWSPLSTSSSARRGRRTRGEAKQDPLRRCDRGRGALRDPGTHIPSAMSTRPLPPIKGIAPPASSEAVADAIPTTCLFSRLATRGEFRVAADARQSFQFPLWDRPSSNFFGVSSDLAAVRSLRGHVRGLRQC